MIQKTIVKSGVSASSLLGIVFIVLKLIGVINWSWWFVLAPFYVPWVFVSIIIYVWWRF